MRIMGAYARRNMEDIDAIRRHTRQLEDGTAGIAYQMGLQGLAPPEQIDGGAFNNIMTKDIMQEAIKKSDR